MLERLEYPQTLNKHKNFFGRGGAHRENDDRKVSLPTLSITTRHRYELKQYSTTRHDQAKLLAVQLLIHIICFDYTGLASFSALSVQYN
jgi:hypothetical protein